MSDLLTGRGISLLAIEFCDYFFSAEPAKGGIHFLYNLNTGVLESGQQSFKVQRDDCSVPGNDLTSLDS